MKRLVSLILSLMILAVAATITACGEKYVCRYCDSSVAKAYYDMDGRHMCEECARQYWVPFDYENYKVK